ncbi:MAG TPA: lytic transglycosylase domain-containing protein [Candidatus Hydrogenedentes bacterium]|nr:lytic transglycosylase domain-containing protein [Candidatus Hydrogenedentota bacterium]HRK32995.1 lytic transglycosylase domain-containing protein [Candidatus Hydrogenedentota bacterium]
MKLRIGYLTAALAAVLAGTVMEADAQSVPSNRDSAKALQKSPIVISDKPARAGNLGSATQNRMKQREEREKYLQEQLEQRRAASPGRTRGMAIYQPRDGGVPLLTNRIEKYEGRKDFRRIKINYDPIVKPDRWGKTTGRYTDSDIHQYVTHYAKQYDLDEGLIHAVIHVESRGNPYAVSPKGASGLMQLMPGTAGDLKVKNVFDPAENIGGGTQYLSKLLKLFNGDHSLALAGYNAGPETVKQYGGIPPYRETQQYVTKVLNKWNELARNGNSVPYKKIDPNESPVVKAAKAKERITTKKLGDPDKASHAIVFASGNVQEVDEVSAQGEYVYLVDDGRTFRLRKELVQQVDGTPVSPLEGEGEIAAIPDATVPLPKDNDVQLAAQI